MGRMKLGQVFDPRSNALNAWRLALASGVILWHCYFLPGRDVPLAPARRLFGAIWVDGFFAISGFLITASWLGKPRVRDYFVARGLRILPGFYTCLLVIAFVVAPIGVAIQGGSAARLLVSSAPIEYILKTALCGCSSTMSAERHAGFRGTRGTFLCGRSDGNCSATPALPLSA